MEEEEEGCRHEETLQEERQAPLSPVVVVVDLSGVLLGFVWLNKSHYGTFSRSSGLHTQSFRFHQLRNCKLTYKQSIFNTMKKEIG